MAADGHIPVLGRKIDSIKALQLRRISLHERGAAFTPRHLFTERASKGGKPSIAGLYSGRAYSGSARAVQEAYINPLISLSLPSLLQSSYTVSS